MTGAAVRLAAAQRLYPGRSAGVGPLDLELAPGAFCAVVGPSGCGKSTLLRLLAGLEPPAAGRVEVDARAPGETAMVFQAPTLLPWLDACGNVDLPLQLLKRSDPEAARAMLARVGLGDAAGVKPAALSGGMAMRVSLARALVTSPRLLLLDEPFAALDALTRRALADDLLDLWRDRRPTIVFVTHDVEEAVYLAERVVILGRGPGRIVGEIETQAPAPRPPAWRASAAFRETVERVTAVLAERVEARA
ncbi:MAG: ABC transporter ATP-binding protein [Alphaproteobacteria bacterium]|nr:ABC transporter ATP-binding protein [Alphaproteobacteria bacterium]